MGAGARAAGAAPQVPCEPRQGVPKSTPASSPNSPGDARGTVGKPCSPHVGCKSPAFTPFHALLPPRGLTLGPWGRGATAAATAVPCSWAAGTVPGSRGAATCGEWGDVPRGTGAAGCGEMCPEGWVPLTSPSLQPSPSGPHPRPGAAASRGAGGSRGSPAVLCLQQKGFLLAFLLPAKCQEGLGLIAAYVYKNI